MSSALGVRREAALYCLCVCVNSSNCVCFVLASSSRNMWDVMSCLHSYDSGSCDDGLLVLFNTCAVPCFTLPIGVVPDGVCCGLLPSKRASEQPHELSRALCFWLRAFPRLPQLSVFWVVSSPDAHRPFGALTARRFLLLC